MGVHFTHVSKWERGETRPRPKTQEKLAGVLGVPESTLFDGNASPTNILTLAEPIPPELREEYEEVERRFNEQAAKDPLFLPRVLRVIRSGLLDTESGLEALESLVRALRPEPENKGADPDQNETKQG